MSDQIDKIFTDIHESYDSMNTILSLGIDKKWREDAAKETVMNKKIYKVLDLATGTGEFALAIRRAADNAGKNVSIVGSDFNKSMLKIAKSKIEGKKSNIRFERGDVLNLRFKNDSFDVITCTFAMRDFDDLGKFAKEIYRVLKRDGKIVLVDMSKPDSGIMKYLFQIYFNIMIIEGMLVDKDAYSFLVSSIKTFDKANLLKLIKKAGFKDVKISYLKSQVAFMVTATKY